jgi:hypothetical protein
MGRKLPFRRNWLKIIFEMEVTIFNQRMFFEVVNMTTIVVPPLEEPEGDVCSIHDTMEVEKPRMAMVLIL